MSSSKGVPDAWDDDWVDNQAGSSAAADELANPTKKLSKAERRRQQYEFNKKLWEEAEAPETPYLVQKTNDIPLQSGFAPQMKVLSRRPAPVTVAKKDPVTGMKKLSVEDDDGEDDEERKAAQLSLEERIEKAKKEREEKQRKYDEVRQRLFGSEDGSTSSAQGAGRGAQSRGRGRGSQGTARSSPARHLFDPSSTPRGGSGSSSGANTPVEGLPIRMPRGPDGSGRGFAQRGGRGVIG